MYFVGGDDRSGGKGRRPGGDRGGDRRPGRPSRRRRCGRASWQPPHDSSSDTPGRSLPRATSAGRGPLATLSPVPPPGSPRRPCLTVGAPARPRRLTTCKAAAVRPAFLALALFLVACGDDAGPTAPEDTTTSVDLSGDEPLPTVPPTEPPTTPPTPPSTTAPTTAAPTSSRAPLTTTPTTEAPAATTARAYANCSEARAAGAAPVRRGEPGYGSHLDRDGDGVGCE